MISQHDIFLVFFFSIAQSYLTVHDNDVTLFQLSDLHQSLVEAARVLNLEAPDLYVRQNPVPNAYTLAISGRKPFIVVHTSLVELLTRKELQVRFFVLLY